MNAGETGTFSVVLHYSESGSPAFPVSGNAAARQQHFSGALSALKSSCMGPVLEAGTQQVCVKEWRVPWDPLHLLWWIPLEEVHGILCWQEPERVWCQKSSLQPIHDALVWWGLSIWKDHLSQDYCLCVMTLEAWPSNGPSNSIVPPNSRSCSISFDQWTAMAGWESHFVISSLLHPPFTSDSNDRASADIIGLKWWTLKTVFCSHWQQLDFERLW